MSETAVATTDLPLDILAATIRARIEAGDKSAEKAADHYRAAGLQLMEAKKRMAETGGKFADFVYECGIGRSRAYELIGIANGTKTVAGIRATVAERVARHADKNKRARQSVSNGQRDSGDYATFASIMRSAADTCRRAEPEWRSMLVSEFSFEEGLSSFFPVDDKGEIKRLKKQLAAAKEKIEEKECQRQSQESRAEIAVKQVRDATSRALFAEADKERLQAEVDHLIEENAGLRSVFEASRNDELDNLRANYSRGHRLGFLGALNWTGETIGEFGPWQEWSEEARSQLNGPTVCQASVSAIIEASGRRRGEELATQLLSETTHQKRRTV